MKYIFYILPLFSGIFMTIQAGVNSQLRTGINSPIGAAFLSFLGGTLSLAFALIVFRQPLPNLQTLSTLEWYKYTGGLLGATFVTFAILSAPKIGISNMSVIIITGQLLTAFCLDYFGLLGFKASEINITKILGLLLVIIGAYLVNQKS
jgi:bacterial/archaeal transporter family-2 protein